jgi:DNA polymerase-3 subunit delta'
MHNAWDTLIGHEWAVRLLSSAIQHDRVGHAYLITGPEQIGKTTLARIFAQALNCQAASAEERPCGRCRACSLIANDRHPDIRLLRPEVSSRGKMTVKIDQVRALQQELSLATYEARSKVAILKRFDMATDGAANAFLKTLEEPPQHVVLLLTANDGDTLLPTIASRCRTIGLRPAPAPLIEGSLAARWSVAPEIARLLAHLADGRLGWAVRAANDPSLLQERRTHLEYLYQALQGNRTARFSLADTLTRKPEALPDVLKTWLSWWRDLLLLTYSGQAKGQPLSITNIDQQDRLNQLAQTWAAEVALTSFQQTNLALWQLDHNANTRLVLENLFLTYPLGAKASAKAGAKE